MIILENKIFGMRAFYSNVIYNTYITGYITYACGQDFRPSPFHERYFLVFYVLYDMCSEVTFKKFISGICLILLIKNTLFDHRFGLQENSVKMYGGGGCESRVHKQLWSELDWFKQFTRLMCCHAQISKSTQVIDFPLLPKPSPLIYKYRS